MEPGWRPGEWHRGISDRPGRGPGRLFVGHCKLWGGAFLEGTAGPNQAADADMMYFLYQVRW